jgi:hypothetical protein
VVIEDASWELFEEQFREIYLTEEFIERQINEFKALWQGGRTVPDYEARFLELPPYAPHLNTEKFEAIGFVLGLDGSLQAWFKCLDASNLHDFV